MKRVIKLSKAWIAALVFGIALTGCGGGSSSDTGSQSPSESGSSQNSGNEQAVKRTAALSWNAPSERQNGDPIDELYELSGYIIRYGQDPENLEQNVYVSNDDNAVSLEYIVGGLTDGTWYFTVQAEDNNGLTSAPSEVVSKTI